MTAKASGVRDGVFARESPPEPPNGSHSGLEEVLRLD